MTPDGKRKVNVVLAVAWLTFGIFGAADYLFGWGLGIAKSIPVLFFISVYANFTGHLGTAAANKAEVKVDEAVEVNVANADEVNIEEK